jgi:hypothetical protein
MVNEEAEMSHTLDVKRIPEILDQLINDNRLTKWERGFCESLQAQLDEGRKLTEQDGGQVDTLEKIYMKY